MILSTLYNIEKQHTLPWRMVVVHSLKEWTTNSFSPRIERAHSEVVGLHEPVEPDEPVLARPHEPVLGARRAREPDPEPPGFGAGSPITILL